MCWRNEWPLCSKEYHKKKKKKKVEKKLQQTGKNGTLEHNDDGKEKVKKVISYILISTLSIEIGVPRELI